MRLPRILVSATRPDQSGALLLVDLETNSCETILPHRVGGLVADGDRFYVLQIDDQLTAARLAIFDRDGLVGTRMICECADAHCLVMAPDGRLALTATASNEIIYLDRDGDELERWSPDPNAEPDAWHLNSLHATDHGLLATCFGRFHRFRDWADGGDGTGLLFEVPSGRVLANSLKNPHDPWRVSGGWIINDSGRKRTVFCSDTGDMESLADLDGFTRGLIVTPELLVVGLSVNRHAADQGSARIAVIDRATRRVWKTSCAPFSDFSEIGHLTLAPETSVIEAVRHTSLPPLMPVAAEVHDPVGSIEVIDADVPTGLGKLQVVLRLRNSGAATWPTALAIDCEVVGGTGPLDTPRQDWKLPVPTPGGKPLTIKLLVDWPPPRQRTGWRHLRFTLTDANGRRWSANDRWSPGVLDLARIGDGVIDSTTAALERTTRELEAALAELDEVRVHRRHAEQQVVELSLHLGRLKDVGPRSLAMAHRLTQMARRFPGLSAACCAIVDFMRRRRSAVTSKEHVHPG
jgi:hypothetical protein